MRQKGQSLLEVTIAIGIAVVVLSALTFITLSGYKNSQVSQNQLTATKIAQSMIEQVRATRDQNKAVCYNTTIKDWPSLFANAATCSGGCDFIIQSGASCGIIGSNPATPYLLSSAIQPVPGNPRFSYWVDIKPTPSSATTVRVQVIVQWNDSGGTHSVNLVTDLGPK